MTGILGKDWITLNCSFIHLTGLEINARKLAKCGVILIICEREKYSLADVCELESCISPKHLKRICKWSHQCASGKKSYEKNFASGLKS